MVLVLIRRERELCPHHFSLITSLSREAFDAEALLKRYRVRGKAEKIFGEPKTGLHPQLSSSARHKSHCRRGPVEREAEPEAETWRPQNEVILLLNLPAFQVMHEGRCGMEPAEGEGWSVVNFREQLLRAGCRVVVHARTMTFHIAQTVAGYWWKLLEIQERSVLPIA